MFTLLTSRFRGLDQRRGWASPRHVRGCGIALLLVLAAAAAPVAAGTPTPSVSYYEYGLNHKVAGLKVRMFQQGYRAGMSGIRKQVVFLDFGAPRIVGDGFGQQIFGFKAPKLSFSQILDQVKAFSDGYHSGWQVAREGSITIAWGTNNGNIPAGWSDATVNSAAQAFAAGINDLRDYKTAQAYNRQHVAAAIDVEERVADGWSDQPITERFVDDLRAASSPPFLINFGSDEIGPYESPLPPDRGFGVWTALGVIHVSRSSRTAACPQIYNQQRVSEWTETETIADNHGPPIYFFCTMAQRKLSPTNFSATEAWNHFFQGLSSVNPNWVAPGHSYLRSATTQIRHACPRVNPCPS